MRVMASAIMLRFNFPAQNIPGGMGKCVCSAMRGCVSIVFERVC